jgi:hypothetical protein
MEYLMTYGWAILIIAVVLGVLFQLGVFSGSALTPKAVPGACQVVRLGGQASLEGECQGQLPQYVMQTSMTANGYVATLNPAINNNQYITIAMWLHLATKGVGTIFTEGQKGTGCANFYINGAPLAVSAWNNGYSGKWQTWTSTTSLTQGAWQFFTYTESSTNIAGAGTATIYINGTQGSTGTLQDTNTPTTPLADFIGALGSGCAPGVYVGSFNGSVTDVQIYNATLSANDIKALYLEGIGGAPIKIQNLVGWWPLNGNAQDYSGNNNNGQAEPGVSFNGSWQSGYSPP